MSDGPAADTPELLAVLLASSLRSGTNYVAAIMATHPDVALVPAGNPTSEVRIVRSMGAFVDALALFRHRCRGLPAEMFSWSDFAPDLGRALLERLWRAAGPASASTLFIKDPNPDHLTEVAEMFPEARYLLVVRDGRDTVSSLLGLQARTSRPPVRKALRRLSRSSGRDTVLFITGWARAVRRILEFEASPQRERLGDRYRRVRYEDLQGDPRAAAEQVFTFYGLSCDEDVLDRAAAVGVTGSTFTGDGQRRSERPTFDPVERDDSFQPVGRWHDWPRHRLALFDRLAGVELAAMGYERRT